MKYLLLILSLISCFCSEAQKLTLGVKAVLPVSTNLETQRQLDYFYADDINSQYTVKPDNKIQMRSVITFKPYMYLMFNDNLFTNYEISYLDYQKIYRIKYNTIYINNISLDTRFNYGFLSNSLCVGYKFLRIKEIRPSVYFGANLLTLIRFAEITQRADEYKLVNLHPYGQIIHQEISTIKDNFFTYTTGFAIDYYVLKFNLEYNFTANKVGHSSQFYRNFNSTNISVGLNLLDFLIKSKKVVKYNTE